MRKLLDHRINDAIKQASQNNHRAIFVIIGDNAKDHVPTFEIFSDSLVLQKTKVSKKIKFGKIEEGETDKFELFLSKNSISFTHYKDTKRALGKTFSMCVLQDFEALTPNVLAQTIETVSGKGLVVFLLRKMSSLKQLVAVVSDNNKSPFSDSLNLNNNRYNNAKTQNPKLISRFNERFNRSLSNCECCVIVDDELNILPITKFEQKLDQKIGQKMTKNRSELESVFEEMAETKPLIHFLRLCRTFDQAKAFLSFVDFSIDFSSKSVFCLNSARGRGKTFVCGLFAAYSLLVSKFANVYVTSPFAQNCVPFFEALCKSLEMNGFSENEDFERILGADKSVVRLNVRKELLQFVQYVSPKECADLAKREAQLLIVDEAAAIPLPITKSLCSTTSGITVLSSTTSGYEGTGRALTLKLVSALRSGDISKNKKANNQILAKKAKFFQKKMPLKEITLEEPIRYSSGDGVEKWLNSLLCLDNPNYSNLTSSVPHPSKCELCLIDRDKLFSGHPAAEVFLAKIMALYSSAHYRNSPNDLQLISDVPTHRLFALINKNYDKNEKTIPDVYSVIQISFEGNLDKSLVQKGFLERVQRAGDLIPWALSTQFQEKEFPSFLGIRIVRIATQIELQGMGYGSESVKQLIEIFSKNSKTEISQNFKNSETDFSEILNSSKNNFQNLQQNGTEKALLKSSKELLFENVDWIGASFGLTQKLLNFWGKNGFSPVYVRQSKNYLTGEHSCIVLKSLKTLKFGCNDKQNESDKSDLLKFYRNEFLRRFVSLLSISFRDLDVSTALSILQNLVNIDENGLKEKVNVLISKSDKNRLKAYSKNLIDFTTIIDILPRISSLIFENCFPKLHLSFVQKAIFVAIGLQRRFIEDLANELNLDVSQLLGLFNKSIRKICKILDEH